MTESLLPFTSDLRATTVKQRVSKWRTMFIEGLVDSDYALM
jgi:hypothetical protein